LSDIIKRAAESLLEDSFNIVHGKSNNSHFREIKQQSGNNKGTWMKRAQKGLKKGIGFLYILQAPKMTGPLQKPHWTENQTRLQSVRV